MGRARELGFTTGGCRSLLALCDDQERASADVRTTAREHLARSFSLCATRRAISSANAQVTGAPTVRSSNSPRLFRPQPCSARLP